MKHKDKPQCLSTHLQVLEGVGEWLVKQLKDLLTVVEAQRRGAGDGASRLLPVLHYVGHGTCENLLDS